MPKRKEKATKAGEVQVQKSPAEFFAENQAIAGFDNLGKSLYTSIRELVENSLDACEAIETLPSIQVQVTEYTQTEFNAIISMGNGAVVDAALFAKKEKKKKIGKNSKIKEEEDDGEEEADDDIPKKRGGKKGDKSNSKATSAKKGTTKNGTAKTRKKAPQDAYFRVVVMDNGCGMRHAAIPDLFGRVLSGSKYGVRQTRGKFGLGAKMALIWSKKSSGQPIRIVTAHRLESSDDQVPERVSTCVLDIDIYKNEPRVIEHTSRKNVDGKVGTTVEVLIAGNWTTYRSRVLQYLQQLAIITPYAELGLTYDNVADPKRHYAVQYTRRSEQMPPPARIVKHHPSSVNNLILQQLVQRSRTHNMVKFLTTELAAVSASLAERLLTELASVDIDKDMSPKELSDKQITRLVQMLRQVQLFKAPDGSCLSPAGEYNLNLGIRKVLEPDLIATARDKASAYEGHPFVVEAAVSLGGNAITKEGISVIRFANRIPLLFEGGADVSTRVAQSKIRWANYKIDHKRDKVGVFVSIVSTKVPFKGTSKEYIGDDATEIQQSVKRALQSCCQKLRVHLLKRNEARDAAQRKSRLIKYVPDVSRAVFGLLDGMRKRRLEAIEESGPTRSSPTKRLRLNRTEADSMIEQLMDGQVTEKSIERTLVETIDHENAVEEQNKQNDERGIDRVPLFLVPCYETLDNPIHDILGENFVFRPTIPLTRSEWNHDGS